MKKLILFLILITTFGFAQPPTQPTPFPNGIKITGGQTEDNTAAKVNVQDASGKINWISKSTLESASSVYCWGDSMTFGTGGTDNNNYPYLLSKSVNWKTVNLGVPGETSTQIKNRFVSYYTASPDELKKPVIIWAGRNNYPDGNTIKADIATMIAMLPHKNYLVIGITNSNPGEPIGNSGYTQIVTLNNDLKTLYGSRFLDVRAWLVANYNPSLPQDVTDHSLDLPPTSLLSDNIHLNNKGYGLVRDLIAKNFPYLSNQSDIAFESVSARNVYLPNTLNSILKTGPNGLITNAAIYENDFNLGLGFVPASNADTQNFEFVNGGSLMNRVAVPQFALSSNAYGTFYASKYKTSNFSTQILLNGNAGTFEINTAPLGAADASISYTNRFYVANNGNIGIGTSSPSEKIDVSGNIKANAGTLADHVIIKSQLDAVSALDANNIKTTGNQTKNGQLTINSNAGVPALTAINTSNVAAIQASSNSATGIEVSSTSGRGIRVNNATGNTSDLITLNLNNVTKFNVDYLGIINGVKTYNALITQSSTGAPTVTVLGNNTIGSIVWTRSGTGTYVGTLSGAFLTNKCQFFTNNTVSGSLTLQRTTDNTITLTTADLTGTLLDGRLTSNSIKIEIYP